MCAKTLTQPIKPYPKEKTLSQKWRKQKKEGSQAANNFKFGTNLNLKLDNGNNYLAS